MSTKKKTKESLLLELSSILLEPWLKPHIDTIAKLRTELLGFTTDEEEEQITRKIKDKIQEEGRKAWEYDSAKRGLVSRRGAIIAATGIGKSKIAIDTIKDYYKLELTAIGYVHKPHFGKALIVVPTEKLRDEGWKAEFEKWGAAEIYRNYVETVCYMSLDTIKDKQYQFVILDEGHNITENNSVFFKQNSYRDVLMLTATRPTDFRKTVILNNLGVKPVYELNLDEAVKLGIVSAYNITVVTMPIDGTERYIKKYKRSTFLNTETHMMDYHNAAVFSSRNPMARINRMQFIYKLRSKTRAAQALLKLIPDDYKTLIFCANKAQAVDLCENRYFTKPSITKFEAMEEEKVAEYRHIMDNWQGTTGLNKFLLDEVNQLSCVNALNEGHNLGLIDIAFIAQLNSKQLHFIQRIGRILRWSPDHKGEIIVVVARDTIDEEWARKASHSLDANNIRWVSIESILDGTESLIKSNTVIHEEETADI